MLTQDLIARGDAQGSRICDADQCLSYSQMAARVDALRARLRHGAYRCVALPMRNDLEALAAFLAFLEAGQSCVPLPEGVEAPPFCDAIWGAEGPEPRAAPSMAEAGLLFFASSGSSGPPKWITHRAQTLLKNASAPIARFGLCAADKVLVPVPIGHMFGLGVALLPALMAGASVRMVKGSPLEILAAERAFDPNCIFMVPGQLHTLMALRRKPRPYRLIVSAGDRLSPDVAEAFEALHGPVVGAYGSSEMGVVAAASPNDCAEIRRAAIGPLMPGMALCGQDITQAPGPISLRNETGFAGYADASGRIAQPAPKCWESGDLGEMGADGRLRVLGRRDHAIKRDGLFVHLSEIEACLSGAPGVAGVVVVAAGETPRGTKLTAYCRGKADADALRAHCHAHLPTRAVPDRFEVVQDLPLLPSGKVDRQRMTARALRDG